MSDKAFLDTNLIVYLYSETEINKRDIAYKCLNSNDCIISTQILNEASNVWTKKYKLRAETVKKYLKNVEKVCDELIIIQNKTIYKALDLNALYGFSYYDCLMLASALESGCDIIFTEDMNDGQEIDGKLKIVNPFKIEEES